MVETAHLDEWRGDDVSVADLRARLSALRASPVEGHSDLRTSVMTHTAWVPRPWLDAARGALAGLADKHPSRTILLVPEPDAGRDAIDATVSMQCFDIPGESRHVCSEVIELHLCGARATAPASIVEPLLVADLPVFSRWRGRPPFGSRAFEQMLGVVDRLIVDSTEWEDVPDAYGWLVECFDRTAVSDLAWRRSLGWRASMATMWPDIADATTLRVAGPKADAILLAGWLRSRLQREVALELQETEELDAVTVDGETVLVPRDARPDPSTLLSAELDQFGRDSVYEDAVRAARSG
jgi:glucose-6-phosphate dehydrogenase assembly protein OpcA